MPAKSKARPREPLKTSSRRKPGSSKTSISPDSGLRRSGDRGIVQKLPGKFKDPCAELKRKLKERDAELKEALEQQTATNEVLKVISSSPTDLKPVFDAILENATRLCEAHMANLSLYDGDTNLTVAERGGSAEYVKWVTNRGPYRPVASSSSARMIAERRPIQIADLRDSSEYRDRTNPSRVALVELGGARTFLVVPMLKEGRVVGIIAVYRPEVRPFSQKQIDLVSTFANQAVIAIENVRLFNETKEALEQQTVISEILRVIGSSPTDTQPVFDAIVQSCTRVLACSHSTLRLVKGERAEFAASTSTLRETEDDSPMPLYDDSLPTSRAVLRREVVQIPDTIAEGVSARIKQRGEQRGFRSLMIAPMLRDNNVMGTIHVHRATPGRFTDKEVALLETFAAQAVIAIENVRLFKELQARNAEITEALEQQTATAEILRVISSSPTDIQPVLDAVAESAARLCDASDVIIRRVDGDVLTLAAHVGPVPDRQGAVALISRKTFMCRAIRECRTIHVPDILEPHVREEYPDAVLAGSRYRTVLVTPLMRKGAAIGAIVLRRPETRPFSDKQIKLLETFAAQAVIAIENVRLFKELQARNAEITEALEQQTATAEILRVISSSPTDLKPVFDAILENATRLCGAHMANLVLYDGDTRLTVAQRGASAEFAKWIADRGRYRPSASAAGLRMLAERRPIQIADLRELPEYRDRTNPGAVARVELGGARTLLLVPMLKEGQAVGGISIYRPEVRPFSQKQTDLVSTFASQAVIAIENVRLFNETKEALEQQTVISEILRVIGSSPTDTQPVFDAIVKSGVHLFGGMNVVLRLVKGDHTETVASTLPADATGDVDPRPIDDESLPGPRAMLRREVVQVPDMLAADEWVSARAKQRAQQRGFRAVMVAPMLREDKVIGTIAVSRATPGPFSDKQVALLKTFADQAVIAIENVRLFKELQARNAEITDSLEQQTVTSEILRIISSSPTDTQPVFDAIVKSGVHLFGGMNVALRLVQGDRIKLMATTHPDWGTPGFGLVNDDRRPVGRAILRREVVQVPDVRTEDWIRDEVKQGAERRGWRATLNAPMMRENDAIGLISVTRATPGPFPDKQVALLKTFADQAVIAIENVRLFKELQARNSELTEALEQQTATSEILRVISNSPTAIEPVLEAVAASAARLCEASDSLIFLRDGNVLSRAAHYGEIPTRPIGATIPITREFLTGRVVLEARTIHTRDLSTETEEFPETVAIARRHGVRAHLATPLLREGTAIGAILIRRAEARPFSDKHIALLQTFADQAVIAIENVRLFKELQARNAEITEALEQQTATAEILRVISSSPTNLQPVFDAILENATRLCDAHMANLALYDADAYLIVAERGGSAEFAEWVKKRGPVRPSATSSLARMIAERRPIQIADLKDLAEYRDRTNPNVIARVELGGARTRLAVPMLKEERLIGGITVYRPEVRPFSQKQIDLVSTFANQAVIAIENVRLFNETKEALEQQTVISEILRVIGSSPTDTQPVFDAIVKSGVHLFGSVNVGLRLVKGDQTELVASTLGLGSGELRIPLSDDRLPAHRAVLRQEVVHVPDISAEDWLSVGYKQRAERRGYRAVVTAPMLRENNTIGVINVNRATPGPFTDRQIALLKTFADQAVIAIENVRLFKELQARNAEITEALEQQTATAEILKVISSSPTDLKPVFDAILESATRLCDAHMANLMLYDGDTVLTVAQRGGSAEYAQWVTNRGPRRPYEGSTAARMIAERQPMQVADLAASSRYRERSNPGAIALVELGGARTYLAVPMLKEGRVVGAISIYRPEVRPFSQKQIDLVSTFANQAVIAIENVRLFNEIQDKSRQLEVASRHKSEFLASMSHELRTPLNAILGFNEMILREIYGEVPADMKEPLEDIQASGKHLLRLINNVLDLAKIEAGRMELALGDYSIADIVESVRSTLRPLAAEKSLEFVVTVPEDIPDAYGDSGRITQCLVNLAGNSLKFTKAGKVEISVRQHDGLFNFCVSDTGVGIPPDKIGSLFTEFKQTDATIASEYGGTGLGLSITRKFIEMHGGRIWVESEVGKGSRFIFEIPVRATAHTEAGERV